MYVVQLSIVHSGSTGGMSMCTCIPLCGVCVCTCMYKVCIYSKNIRTQNLYGSTFNLDTAGIIRYIYRQGFAKSLHRGHSSNIRPVKLCMQTLVKTFCADVTNKCMPCHACKL